MMEEIRKTVKHFAILFMVPKVAIVKRRTYMSNARISVKIFSEYGFNEKSGF